MTSNQIEFVRRVIDQSLPLVGGRDHCAVLWGSRVFGYATDKSDYDINVIHTGTKSFNMKVTSAGHKYDLTFVPRRTLFRVYTDSAELLQLVPLGKVISTSNGQAQVALNNRRISPEWRRELLKDVRVDVFSATYPKEGQTASGVLGQFLRQVYAYLVREHLIGLGSDGLDCCDICALAERVGGSLLAQDVRDVIVLRNGDFLKEERLKTITKLANRLILHHSDLA